MKYYSGIGSRSTPYEIQCVMTKLASSLEDIGYILRSGGAFGADRAFEAGVKFGNKEIFLANTKASEGALEIAARIHPAWDTMSDYGKACHARNVYQILGESLKDPVEFVLCWTPEAKEVGGTRTGIVLAREFGIPVYNFADTVCFLHLMEKFNNFKGF